VLFSQKWWSELCLGVVGSVMLWAAASKRIICNTLLSSRCEDNEGMDYTRFFSVGTDPNKELQII
jgi:hypothetical protein